MAPSEATAPHHVAGVRAWFIDHVRPDELAVLDAVFARMDAALPSTSRVAAAHDDDG